MFRHLLLSFLVSSFPLLGQDIRVMGSDLFGGVIEDSFTEGWRDESQRGFAFEFSGSFLGEKAIAAGKADVAILALKEDLTAVRAKYEQGFWVYPLAFKTFYLLVNEKNPVREMNFRDLREVFAQNGDPVYRSWSAITGTSGLLGSKPIQIAMLEGNMELARGIFQSQILQGEAFRTDAVLVKEINRLEDRVLVDSTSLVLSSRMPSFEGVRVLSLAGEGQEFAFSPSAENLYYGDYPYGLTFYLLVKRELAVDGTDFMEQMYSAGISDLIGSNGFVALPASARSQVLGDIR